MVINHQGFLFSYLCVKQQSIKMDISGTYEFTEDFGFGKDKGEAILHQMNDILEGKLSFTEYIDEEEPFKVTCDLKGTINGNEVEFNVENCQTGGEEYYPEVRNGIINNKGQIVGSSVDEQGVCGVFVLTPKLEIN